jgi:hypothetical protein
MRLVQIRHPGYGRAVAIVEGDSLRLLAGLRSVHALARAAIASGVPLVELAAKDASDERLAYQPVYDRASPWSLLPPLDHPDEPARCLVTGTGLTHLASALNRQSMHAATTGPAPTDSMRMFEWGVAGGRPAPDEIGVQPEWFYKGTGACLRAHGEPLDVPAFAGDGGDEAEIAGLYVVDDDGAPRRVGFAIGNEFSDHRMEERNYLYLAPSKLRTCALGPELVLDAGAFADVRGEARIERDGAAVWTGAIATGEANMSHSLANLEHHHFKHASHRRGGDVHVHFFGADVFSYGAGIALRDGDVMSLAFSGFGRPLRNPVRVHAEPAAPVRVRPL